HDSLLQARYIISLLEDALLQKSYERAYNLITQLKAIIGTDFLLNATLHLVNKTEHSLDTILGLGIKIIDYLIDGILSGAVAKEMEFDALLSQSYSINYLTSVYLLMTASLQYTLNSVLEGQYAKKPFSKFNNLQVNDCCLSC
ncbi:MAG: hypothetical protein DRN17_07200, partial [Thermoplasmata archaeon]